MPYIVFPQFTCLAPHWPLPINLIAEQGVARDGSDIKICVLAPAMGKHFRHASRNRLESAGIRTYGTVSIMMGQCGLSAFIGLSTPAMASHKLETASMRLSGHVHCSCEHQLDAAPGRLLGNAMRHGCVASIHFCRTLEPVRWNLERSVALKAVMLCTARVARRATDSGERAMYSFSSIFISRSLFAYACSRSLLQSAISNNSDSVPCNPHIDRHMH